ncbi:MAG: bifunctional ADP-dependent NAD(P)H-hydrate dehydratase/NAD(P)H-hydrate epimerase [Candidatus Rokuibacteriota bacterium]|nr:MAG: bifunctional ADP-dependent NAD(P)H-hydrate dehydratase/NAD(P)H-hydrate epimerase [Candidatus Rokubacteria bacterium]
MLPVFTAEEMRRLDRRAIDTLGIPGATLMENAGQGAAREIARLLPRGGRGARVVIVCGKGGNGGDGFVVARRLKQSGARVAVWLTTRSEDIGGDAGAKLTALRRTGLRPVVVEDEHHLAQALGDADLVVDALLGTGARGAPSGVTAGVIEVINASGRRVVSLDIPSGLPADGGPPAGSAVNAEVTTTFAGLKRGLVTGAGLDWAGRAVVVGIGVPDAEVRRGVSTFLLEQADVARHLPPRRHSAHKGTYGRLLIVAGSLGKTGAAALAARAAMRSGAGLVTVATATSQQPIVAALVLEAMTEPLPETSARSISLKARDLLDALAETRDAVAAGPGLGLDDDTQALAREFAHDLRRPLVLDADALTALAGHLDALRGAAAPRCLTPHPGELARMLGQSLADVERDRIETARSFATAHGVHLVLKGAGTVIAEPNGDVYVNPTGNPGMASGGTGDVLTGIVGALLARGLEPGAAVQTGVYLHGAAGDVAAGRVGEEALIASDVIAALPDAFASVTPRRA